MDRKEAVEFQGWVGEKFAGIDKWNGQDLTVKGSRCTYDPTTGEVKVSLTFLLGDAKASARAEFDLFARRLGLGAADYGRTFQFAGHGRTYTISGIKPRARKRPILATAEDGRTYVFEAEAVVRQLRPWNMRTEDDGSPGGIYFYSSEADEQKREKAWKASAKGRWAERKGGK